MKTFVLVMLFAIVASLFSALYFLARKDEASSKHMLTALKFRVGLSVTLVAFLVAAYFLGFIPTQ